MGTHLRSIIRAMVHEYVANDKGDVHHDDHADPSAKAWDAGLDEDDSDHEGDPRWDDHADPTGKEWSSGLDEGTGEWNVAGAHASKSSNGSTVGIDAEPDGFQVELEQGHGYMRESNNAWIPLDVIIKLLESVGYTVTRAT